MDERTDEKQNPEVAVKKRQTLKHLAGVIFVITFLAAVLIALIGWIAGWKTSLQYSNGYFITGAAVILLGMLSVIGNYQIRSNFGVQYSQSSGSMNLSERTRLWVADLRQGYNALIVCAISGGLLIGLAVLVDKIFG